MITSMTCAQLLQPRALRYSFVFKLPTTTRRVIRNMSTPPTSAFYGFKPLDKTGTPFDLSSLQGKVVLVVNTASKCGFTPQYESLERLYQDVKKSHPTDSDFTILGFPCNQFGGQEPGSNDEIQQFCTATYGVTFPILGKVDVNGNNVDPLWEWLKKEKPGLLGMQRVKWNFEKFLVGRDGTVKGRWASTTKPESLMEKVEEELGKAT